MKTRSFCFAVIFCLSAFSWAANGLYEQGETLYSQGKFDQALQAFQGAVQNDPNDWRIYQAIGNCRYRLKDVPGALEAYNKSLALHPENTSLRSFVNGLQPAPQAPSGLGLPAAAPGSDAANSGTPGSAKELAADLLDARARIARDQRSLLDLSGSVTLDPDQFYLAHWGAPKSSFYDAHWTLDFGFLTPTGMNLDIGFFTDPTTNLGITLFYLPLPVTEYDDIYNSGTGTYTYQLFTLNRDLIYIEPRIKFYSAPSGLTSYHGFSFIYYGLHQGKYPDGYYETSFDILGLGYMVGFRTLPMDGMTMELGWKMGVAAIFLSQMNYVYQGPSSYQYVPGQIVVPFPYIIPEFRFGFTF